MSNRILLDVCVLALLARSHRSLREIVFGLARWSQWQNTKEIMVVLTPILQLFSYFCLFSEKICQHIELVNDLLLLVIYHLYYNICHKIRLASRPSTCLNLHVVQNRQKKQIPSFNNLE